MEDHDSEAGLTAELIVSRDAANAQAAPIFQGLVDQLGQSLPAAGRGVADDLGRIRLPAEPQ